MNTPLKKFFSPLLVSIFLVLAAIPQTNAADETSVTESSNIASTADAEFEKKIPGRNRPEHWLPSEAIPIVAILAAFGFPTLIIGMGIFARINREKRLHETIRTMIEKGVPIPPDLFRSGSRWPFDKPERALEYRSDLNRGIRGVVLGLGLMIVLRLLPDLSKLWPVGLIFLFLGLARLICWKVEKKTPEQNK